MESLYFRYLPPGIDIVALDISLRMIEQARAKAAQYRGKITLLCMDAQQLAFPEDAFDTALTVCTFCSVPNPVQGLKEIRRVLKPDGQLLMFEHVRSRIGPFALFLDFMTFLTRKFGPDLNRDTVGNVLRADFRLRREENVYLDIVKIIEAVK
jgi:phosphatidylethanolamine/phosphatidyl-N-methylethanolamine N-methyltransferase